MKISLQLKASLIVSLSLMAALLPLKISAQSILPPRPEAVDGGNPFEGLGRPDDPNPSRAGDFPELSGVTGTPSTSSTSNTAAANSDAPQDPNLNQITGSQPSVADTNTPGAAEALLQAQQLAKEEGVLDPSQQKPGLFGPEAAAGKPAANQNEASFFKVVADSPIRTVLVDIREGRYEQALNQLKVMYDRQPSAIELQYLMGVSAVMLHRNPEAIAHYQRVIDDKHAPLRLKTLAQKGLTKLHGH